MTLRTSHSFTLRWVERAIAVLDAAGSTFITSAQLAGWWNQELSNRQQNTSVDQKEPSNLLIETNDSPFWGKEVVPSQVDEEREWVISESSARLYGLLCEEEEGKRAQVDLSLYDEWDVLGALAMWLKERWKRIVPASTRGELVDAAITFYEKNYSDGARAKLFSCVTKLEVEALTILRTVAGAVVRSESAGYVDSTLNSLAERYRNNSNIEDGNVGVELVIGPLMFMPYCSRTVDNSGSVLEEQVGNPIASSMAILLFAKVYSQVLFKTNQSKGFLGPTVVNHIPLIEGMKEKKPNISFLSKFSKREANQSRINDTDENNMIIRGSVETKLEGMRTRLEQLQKEVEYLKEELHRMQQANNGRVEEISETFDFWTQLLLSETRASLSLEKSAREKLEKRVHYLEDILKEKIPEKALVVSKSVIGSSLPNGAKEFTHPVDSNEQTRHKKETDSQDDDLFEAFQEAVGVSLSLDAHGNSKHSSSTNNNTDVKNYQNSKALKNANGKQSQPPIDSGSSCAS
ncbi:uncharacterized protein Gasu_10820 [Galdieria sulphuraria]|uniref:Uncharacterized protein n=1 Tax=Galdieria sulphuraria TaxID=130081 RepID=M2Y6N7_GALSU|nr:uncharacterized protein Gasu_10820 [Galdieria sulphuraria]EME31703.1 hypothetical protein Gasu_10820 [Galdieria sulphuraria]|eukprot:XP_005708223.1 hypothetical protein Gasu_10820 [Galdieria sulphuraria]